MTARRRKDGLINDANIEMIRAARGRTELELLRLFEPFVPQEAIAAICGRSQSWVSRNSQGGIGRELNRAYMLGYRKRRRDMKQVPIDPEFLIRLHAERLAAELKPVIESATAQIVAAIKALPVRR